MNKMEEIEYIDVSNEETNLSKIENNGISVKSEESVQIKKTIKEDFEFARENIKSMVNTGMAAVKNLAIIADSSEHPRIFECLTNLLQVNTLNNSLLLDLDSKMKNMIDGREEKDGPDSVVNNNTLFVATTTDIQRMIEERIKGIK